MKRCASSDSDISRLNSATGSGSFVCSATFSAMLVTSADFAHRWSCGDDDQVAGLEAAGDLVEVGEARRRAGQRLLAGGEVLPDL